MMMKQAKLYKMQEDLEQIISTLKDLINLFKEKLTGERKKSKIDFEFERF